MANRKVKMCFGAIAAAAVLTILSPQTATYAAEMIADEFDMTDVTQWEDRLVADVNKDMNIRREATTSSSVVGKLAKGEVARIISEEDGWTRICIGELEGYVSDLYTLSEEEAYDYAMENGCQAVTMTEAEVPVYEKPEEQAELIASLMKGDQLKPAEVTEESIGWIAVNYGEQIGYVKKTQVKLAWQITPVHLPKGAYTCSEEDIQLLAALLECEAGGTSYEGLLAVASVVMNRMESDRFANTLYDVIYEKHQFTPAMNGKVARVLAAGSYSQEAYEAAAAALCGERNTDCYFFQSARLGHRGTKIGGNIFY